MVLEITLDPSIPADMHSTAQYSTVQHSTGDKDTTLIVDKVSLPALLLRGAHYHATTQRAMVANTIEHS